MEVQLWRPYCRVGGERNNAVIWGYSSKGHEGYLGNSVLGEWCNIGADSNNPEPEKQLLRGCKALGWRSLNIFENQFTILRDSSWLISGRKRAIQHHV